MRPLKCCSFKLMNIRTLSIKTIRPLKHFTLFVEILKGNCSHLLEAYVQFRLRPQHIHLCKITKPIQLEQKYVFDFMIWRTDIQQSLVCYMNIAETLCLEVNSYHRFNRVYKTTIIQ